MSFSVMKMNKKLVAATHNKGKLREFSRILQPLGIELIPVPEGIMENIEETGATFAENAVIKAKAVFEAVGIPAMADDSGLCIDALGGEPGVRSARFMGEDTPYSVKNAAIIEKLEGVPENERSARFKCAIAIVGEGVERVFEGVFEGKIGNRPMGENGFGYDPIFYVGGISSAQMSDEQKDSVSHRGMALRAMAKEINDII